jgi:hypothetical protein
VFLLVTLYCVSSASILTRYLPNLADRFDRLHSGISGICGTFPCLQDAYISAHITLDLDGSNGLTKELMKDTGAVPFKVLDNNIFAPGVIYQITESMQALKIDIPAVKDLFFEVNQQYYDTRLFSCGLYALWEKLEPVLKENVSTN